MSFQAKVLQVMIASPSDVTVERDDVRRVLTEWNALHAQTFSAVLLPLGWDTHASPSLSGRPQQLINDRVLREADLLVGIFWTRLGSSTGRAASGTVEEIQEHHKKKKPIMLYFSDAPVHPGSVDTAQYDALIEFRKWARSQGIVHTYSQVSEFTSLFRQHLQMSLRDEGLLGDQAARALTEVALSDDAAQAIRWMAEGEGRAAIFSHLSGTSITIGKNRIASDAQQRESARWVAAVRELVESGLADDVGGKGQVFSLNHQGYLVAERD